MNTDRGGRLFTETVDVELASGEDAETHRGYCPFCGGWFEVFMTRDSRALYYVNESGLHEFPLNVRPVHVVSAMLCDHLVSVEPRDAWALRLTFGRMVFA